MASLCAYSDSELSDGFSLDETDESGRSEAVSFSVGDTFSTYDELKRTVAEYERSSFVQVWKRDARTIDAAKKRIDRVMKPELQFYQLKFCCIHGGKKFKSESKGMRSNM